MGEYGIPLDQLFWIWAETFVRWLHVIAGIAWIGSSFYFIALDLSLKQRGSLPEGAHGDAWQVHGGGFYHLVKYLVAPSKMPEELTWFKWEAYTTWLSGAVLMALVYYAAAELYLIDYGVMDLEPWQAVVISIGGVIAGWVFYDLLCRSPLGRNDLALMLVGYVFLIALAYGFAQVLSPRGAFMQMGVIVGTIMVANVAMVIIPGQRKVVAALLKGEKPDPEYGRRGKQRSLHNNYLTLPVVFVMIGGHYPLVFATAYAWAIFAVVVIMGVLIRHFFNTKHKDEPWPWWTWGAVAALGVILVWLSAAGPRWNQDDIDADEGALAPPTEFAELEERALEVVDIHCVVCHQAEPGWDGIVVPPKGVRFDDPALLRFHATRIAEQAAWSRAMPPGNVTSMAPEERRVLAAWAARAGG